MVDVLRELSVSFFSFCSRDWVKDMVYVFCVLYGTFGGSREEIQCILLFLTAPFSIHCLLR